MLDQYDLEMAAQLPALKVAWELELVIIGDAELMVRFLASIAGQWSIRAENLVFEFQEHADQFNAYYDNMLHHIRQQQDMKSNQVESTKAKLLSNF